MMRGKPARNMQSTDSIKRILYTVASCWLCLRIYCRPQSAHGQSDPAFKSPFFLSHQLSYILTKEVWCQPVNKELNKSKPTIQIFYVCVCVCVCVCGFIESWRWCWRQIVLSDVTTSLAVKILASLSLSRARRCRYSYYYSYQTLGVAKGWDRKYEEGKRFPNSLRGYTTCHTSPVT